MEDLYYDAWPDQGKLELEATQVDDEGLAQGPAEGEGDRSAGKGVAAGGMAVARGAEGPNDGAKDAHGAEDVYDSHRDDDTEDEEDIEDIQTLPPPTPAKDRSELGDELDADIEEGMEISSFESEEGSTGMSGAASDKMGPGAMDGKASSADSASNGSKAKSKRPRADAGSKGQKGPETKKGKIRAREDVSSTEPTLKGSSHDQRPVSSTIAELEALQDSATEAQEARACLLAKKADIPSHIVRFNGQRMVLPTGREAKLKDVVARLVDEIRSSSLVSPASSASTAQSSAAPIREKPASKPSAKPVVTRKSKPPPAPVAAPAPASKAPASKPTGAGKKPSPAESGGGGGGEAEGAGKRKRESGRKLVVVEGLVTDEVETWLRVRERVMQHSAHTFAHDILPKALSRIEGAFQASSGAASSSGPIVLSTKDQARELMLRVTPTVATLKLGANEKKAWEAFQRCLSVVKPEPVAPAAPVAPARASSATTTAPSATASRSASQRAPAAGGRQLRRRQASAKGVLPPMLKPNFKDTFKYWLTDNSRACDEEQADDAVAQVMEVIRLVMMGEKGKNDVAPLNRRQAMQMFLYERAGPRCRAISQAQEQHEQLLRQAGRGGASNAVSTRKAWQWFDEFLGMLQQQEEKEQQEWDEYLQECGARPLPTASVKREAPAKEEGKKATKQSKARSVGNKRKANVNVKSETA